MDFRSNFAEATRGRAKILKQYVRVIHNKDYCISFVKVKNEVNSFQQIGEEKWARAIDRKNFPIPPVDCLKRYCNVNFG
ncbi:MAG: hypothetical protein D6728_04175 [Cyanobacteria bacterium J055]|nr:MAG: hypothetical protein D6728_04175 [Cyanobacteria bacterium J055]